MISLNFGHSHVLKKLSSVLPPLLWAGLIFGLSAQPTLPAPPDVAFDFFFKKAAHITVYTILCWLTLRAMKANFGEQLKFSLIAVILCILYAASDEFHQSFVFGRTATVRDVYFDSLGIFIGWLRWYRYV